MINFFPLHGQILVSVEGDQSLGGLFTEAELEDGGITVGMVVRTGRGYVTREGVIPTTSRKGDEIVFTCDKGVQLRDGEHFFYLIQDSDVLSILSRDPNETGEDEWQVSQGIDLTGIIEKVAQQMKSGVEAVKKKIIAETLTTYNKGAPNESPKPDGEKQ